MYQATHLSTDEDANVGFNTLHSTKMPTGPSVSPPSSVVLLAWEHGRNLGHIGRLLATAQGIEQQGLRPVWAVPQAFINAPEICNLNHNRIPAPSVRLHEEKVAGPIHSFADILISFGFTDVESLTQTVKAWMQLIERINPSSIVLDYAPAAQLAALLLGLPAYQITNGFDSPPPDCPVYGLTVRGPYLDRVNNQKVSAINSSIAQVCQRLGGLTGLTLQQFFAYPQKIYDCLPETDPYGPRSDGLMVGPMSGLAKPADNGLNIWDFHPETQVNQRVFAYLRNLPGATKIAEALNVFTGSVLCVWPDAPAQWLDQTHNSRLRIQRAPVDLRAALAGADVVVGYGGVTTACHALMAGKPQLMAPSDVEKTLLGRRIAALGAGLVWHERISRTTATEALHMSLANEKFANSAQRIASQYSQKILIENRAAFIQSMTGGKRQPSNH